MIPNLAQLIWIYGLLGWLDWPIDIAMMLSLIHVSSAASGRTTRLMNSSMASEAESAATADAAATPSDLRRFPRRCDVASVASKSVWLMLWLRG